MTIFKIDIDSYSCFISKFPSALPNDLIRELSERIIALKNCATAQTIRVINFHGKIIANPEQILFTFLKLRELEQLNADGTLKVENRVANIPDVELNFPARNKKTANYPKRLTHEEWLKILRSFRHQNPEKNITQYTTHIYRGRSYRIGGFIARIKYGEVKVSASTRASILALGIPLDVNYAKDPRSFERWLEALQDWRENNPDIKLPSKQVWSYQGEEYNLGSRMDWTLRNGAMDEAQRELFLSIAKGSAAAILSV